MLAQVYLIEPEKAADVAHKAPRKTPYLSVRERKALADERNVGSLYDPFVQLANGRLFTNSQGRSRVGLVVRTKDGGTRTVMVVHLGESTPETGLKFRLNASQLMEHFSLTEEEVQGGLPDNVQNMPATEWRGAATSGAEDWKGFKGAFHDQQAVEAFFGVLHGAGRRA